MKRSLALLALLPSLALAEATPAAVPPAPVGTPPATASVPETQRVTSPAADAHFFTRQAFLQREIRILELEARRRELQDEIAGVRDQPSPSPQAGPAPIIPVPAPPPAAAPEVPAGPPPLPFVLLSIYGGEGRYTADFAVGAARVSLQRGGELPGGWTVHGVGPFEVELRRGTQRRTLRLGG